MKNIKGYFRLLTFCFITGLVIIACKKHDDIVPENTTNTIKIDSLVPTKRNLVVWEESYITVYAKGQNLKYKWEADHGSMMGKDSTTVTYWACPSCLGNNTIKCVVSNESGRVSDTVMVHVTE
ncbi:MAG: hypothetical protein NTU44_14895 [Bacteroidetes bacterium]|nr:hypothetical protein [Bacteroidota bacterium]